MAINYLNKARRGIGSTNTIMYLINELSLQADRYMNILVVSPYDVERYVRPPMLPKGRNITWFNARGNDSLHRLRGRRWGVVFILDFEMLNGSFINDMMYDLEYNSREIFIECTRTPTHEIYTND